jgi:ubiquinone/menaquinone biosynthesis C-methylase UbiE
MLILMLIILVLVIGAITILWRLLSKRYSIPCPSWLAWIIEIDNPFIKIHHAETIIEYLDVKKGMSVLDVGCGPGRVTIPIAKKVGSNGHVTAMDIQEEMLNKARGKAQKENLNNITFLHAGIGQRKLTHNNYDYALLVTVLGEIPDRESAMKEIFDSLKCDGILSVTEIILDPHYQRRSDIIRFAKNVGFKKIKEFGNWIGYTLHFQK